MILVDLSINTGMKLNYGKRTIGLNFDNGQAAFWLWAPHLKQVALQIESNETQLNFSAKAKGYWLLEDFEIKPGDKYHLIIETAGEARESVHQNTQYLDPAMLWKCVEEDRSIAYDLTAFRWTDNSWRVPELEAFIIYELHCGTFTPDGDFSGIKEKLDYLKDLGITAIEIMPVSQFSGSRNWGYDGVYPFAVQNSYGGPNALQHLINACHNKGLAVILDVVYNHVGPEGNHYEDFGPYFTDKYQTPWGKAINFDDAQSDEVRKFYLENVLMWFRDFHIDALRLDAVHAIKDFSARHFLEEVKLATDKLSLLTDRKCYLIVESDLNDNRYINPFEVGGYGMDAQWIDEFHHALRVASGQPKTGYYEDFNGVEHLAKSYRDAYVYDGQYSNHRQKTFGRKATGNTGKQFVVFSQNHDQVGNRMLGERSSVLVTHSMLRLMAGAVFISPFIPLIFMGEEYAEENPFLFFVSHKDHELIEAVRKGRKAEFSAFHQQGEAPDPQSSKTFESSKLNWEQLKLEEHKSMFAYYKRLIALRKHSKVLKNLDRDCIHAEALTTQQTIMLKRWNAEETLFCILNFSDQCQSISEFIPRNASLIFSSEEKIDEQFEALTNSLKTIIISPETLLIFSESHV
ncbi:malto-oligosyltrehalose trehalohydrolase [Pedobacter sp.]|uniref:malto-oligosyltrehalose trehalohydrolase n=1 Tax=Pedobacter sp. TaxID=1411316 RepID=UPI003BACA318